MPNNNNGNNDEDVKITSEGGMGRMTVPSKNTPKASKCSDASEQLGDVMGVITNEYNGALKDAYLGQIKIANSMQDPEAKIKLLRQVYDSVTRRDAEVKNGLNYNAPRPNMIKNRGMADLDVPEEEFLPAAYSNPEPEELYNRLRMMEQKVEADFSKFAMPLDASGTAITDQVMLEGLRQVRDLIDDVGGIHYEIVKWGLLLYVLASVLHDAYQVRRFLAIKYQVETILAQYNAHSPYLALRLEERELIGAQSLVATAVALARYLGDPEFGKIKLAAQGKGKSKGSSSMIGSDLLNVLPPKDVAPTESLVAAVAMRAGPRGKWAPKAKAKGVHVAAFTIAVPPEIDLKQDPVIICQSIQTAILQYINTSLSAIRDIKLVGSNINFNVYTGQWGSIASIHDNITMMDAMRKDLLEYFMAGWERTSFLIPKFFLVDQYCTYLFTGAYGPGTSVHTITLGLAEEREVRVKTTETTKESRSKTSSVFDSFNESAQDSLELSEEQELTSSNTSMAEVASYIDTNRTAEQSQQDRAGIDAGIKWGVLTAEGKIQRDKNASVNEGVEAGSNSTMNNTREESARRTSGSLANHTRDVGSKRDTSVSESSDASSEVTKEESMTVKIKNPNRAAPLTMIFMNMVQEYHAYTCLVNVRLMFSNGVFKQEVQVSDADRLLDLYLQPTASATRQRINETIAAAAKVLDFQNRLLDLLDTSKSLPAIKNTLYLDLLQEKIERSGGKMDARDVEMMAYKKYIKGVVISEEIFTLPTPGLFVHAVVGRPALDENEQRLFDIDAQRQEQELESLKKRNGLIDTFVEVLGNISDATQQASILVLLLASGKDIFNNMYAASLMGSSVGGTTLPDSLKGLAKSLKLDLK